MGLEIRAGRVAALIRRYDHARSIAERRYLRAVIDEAVRLTDPGAISLDVLTLLKRRGLAPPDAAAGTAPAPPHAVHVPLVARPSEEGFARLLYVTYRVGLDPAACPTLDTAATAAVHYATALATVRTGRANTEAVALVPAQPEALEGVRLEGPSLGAAAFVSVCSLLLHRAVRAGTLISGALRNGHVAGVGGVDAKLRGALLDREDVRRIVVAREDEAAARAALRAAARARDARHGRRGAVVVLAVATLDELLAACLEEHATTAPVLDDAVGDALRDFRRGWDAWRWAGLVERLERLAGETPHARPDLQVRVFTMLGATHRHLGRSLASVAFLEHARFVAGAGADSVPDELRSFLLRHLALTYRDLCRFGAAERAARGALAAAGRGRLRSDKLKALGCAGIVALAAGAPARAARHFQAGLDLARAAFPSEAPRTGAHLVEALGLAGDLPGARRVYTTALRSLEQHVPPEVRGAREAWLRTSLAGALVLHRRLGEARHVLDAICVANAAAHAPLPGLLIRRHLGVAAARGVDREHGYSLLAASPVAYGPSLERHLRFRAEVNVLVEAQVRLARGDLGEDAATRALTALDAVPTDDAARRFFGPAVARTRRALEAWLAAKPAKAGDRSPRRDRRAMPEPSLESVLDHLLGRCLRLA